MSYRDPSIIWEEHLRHLRWRLPGRAVGVARSGAAHTGDEIELTVEQIGTIRTTVVDGPPVHPIPHARRKPFTAPD